MKSPLHPLLVSLRHHQVVQHPVGRQVAVLAVPADRGCGVDADDRDVHDLLENLC